MNVSPLSARLAVCSWSLQPTSPQDFISLKATGVRRVQLALDPIARVPALWGRTPALFDEAGIEDRLRHVRSPSARTTRRWRPSRSRAASRRTRRGRRTAEHPGTVPIAEQLGCRCSRSTPASCRTTKATRPTTKLMQRLREVADIFGARRITLGLETGQETAPALLDLLEKLDRPNVGVNFDPANMVLYDKGDPIDALSTLAPWIRQVHIKDGDPHESPGHVGRGSRRRHGRRGLARVLRGAREVGYTGDLCIEREAGTQRVADIAAAREIVEEIWHRSADLRVGAFHSKPTSRSGDRRSK